MRDLMRLFLGVLASLAIAGAGVAVRAQTPPAAGQPASTIVRSQAETRSLFNGLWDYNADESVDAATGRTEQSPVSATQRRAGPGTPTTTNRGVGGRGGGGRGGGGDFGGGNVGGSGFGGSGFSSGLARARAAVTSISRALVRDLMEVPEQLLISVDDTSVTFVDDLERTLEFPVDGSKNEYHLSASTFDVRARWNGVQFRKDIEGARGFRMVETYFVSADGTRLFVILRLGDDPPPEGMPVNGVNRVYDRVSR